jgi:HEAT repeat protein
MLRRRDFCGYLGATALLGRLPSVSNALDSLAEVPNPPHVYAYVTCGDNQWNLDSLPVDSHATVEAIFEFLSNTFQIKRVYWRGEQDRMWQRYVHFRPENPLYYDHFVHWLGYLYNELKINEIAVAAAHRRGMQIYIFDGLLDLGATADTSGSGLYPNVREDRLRIKHPEWCPVDRWGERLCPGPIEFCYPEARQALLSRYLHHVTKYGYDGIFFYTYIENCGARYLDEYGFNEPIVKEYEHRHGVDIRKQPFNKEDWYRLRGEYLTRFIRELHRALAAKGKKLSMAIYPPTPNYPEPWDGGKVDIPQPGNVYMDWYGWVRDGIVDELFVWWRGDQKALLKRMLQVCQGKPVELTVADSRPFDSGWKPFIDAGVTPVSVWAPGFDLDRVSAEPSKAEALKHPDWRWRMQALKDVAAGKLEVEAKAIATLAHDSHVLVRRHAMFALGALQDSEQVPLLEAALVDEESSVRIGAAVALGKVNGPESAQRMLAALLSDDKFQMRLACVKSLAAMKERALPALLEGITSASPAVRDVCVRVFAVEAPACEPNPPTQAERAPCVPVPGRTGLPGAQEALLSVLENEKEDLPLFYAITAMAGYRSPEVIEALLGSLRDGAPKVQMWVAASLTQMTSAMSPDQSRDLLSTLTALFREFGDNSERPDAAWGWRVIGNTMCACGQAGKKALEAMRTQQEDHWLAWAAYEVLYVPQSPEKATLCEEREAVEMHAKYAPTFPGRRT